MEATDKEIENWIRRMEACYKAIPKGCEAHVSYTSVTLYKKGKLQEHMLDDRVNGYGISDDSEIAIAITGENLIPYSECT